MDRSQIEAVLNEVRSGSTSVPDALERLRNLPFEDLGFAKLDHHRALRTGMPEVIFAESKTPAQVATIFARMATPAEMCWQRALRVRYLRRCETQNRARNFTKWRGPSRSSKQSRLPVKEQSEWFALGRATCR